MPKAKPKDILKQHYTLTLTGAQIEELLYDMVVCAQEEGANPTDSPLYQKLKGLVKGKS